MYCGSTFRHKAITMRRNGFSLSEISRRLNIAKSTSSLWLKNVEVSTRGKMRLKKAVVSSRLKYIKTIQIKRELARKQYLSVALQKLKQIQFKDVDYQIYCSLLYWAEGGKFTDNHLEFTNSDPNMIKAFLNFLRRGFEIDETNLRINIHINGYHNKHDLKTFWQKVTRIPLSQFNKSYLKPHTKKVIRENYPGCVRICYYSADTARKIKAIYTLLAKI